MAQFISYCGEVGLELSTIEPKDARDYIAILSSKYKANTVKRKVSAIRCQLDLFLEDSGTKESNPFRSEIASRALKAMQKDKALQRESVNKAKGIKYEDVITIFRCLERSTRMIDHRDRVLIMVAFLGGFRRSEIAALRWSDIEVSQDGVKIRIATSKGKSGWLIRGIKTMLHGGIVSVPPLLEAWKHVIGSKSEFVFPVVTKAGDTTGKPIDGKTVGRILKKHFGNEVSGHSVRRGFITESYRRGASLIEIGNQTGQKPATIQAHYLNELDKAKNNAVRFF